MRHATWVVGLLPCEIYVLKCLHTIVFSIDLSGLNAQNIPVLQSLLMPVTIGCQVEATKKSRLDDCFALLIV